MWPTNQQRGSDVEHDPEKGEVLAWTWRHSPKIFLGGTSKSSIGMRMKHCWNGARRWTQKKSTRWSFLDPFGASVEWKVIKALANTEAVDLWFLFPYGAIIRMLVSDAMPPNAWAKRLTRIFGTEEWQKKFYSTSSWQSLIDEDKKIQRVYKTADQEQITECFVKRLKDEFAEVAQPGFLHNSRGSLLFVLLFAAGNAKGANAGIKIANDLLTALNKSPF
jgi:three-Cys-motif partner protein